jgi:uncharacterized protein (DUF934 family)
MQPERVIRVDPPRVETDAWLIVEDVAAELPRGRIMVPLATWVARRDELLARAEHVGVWLAPGDAPEPLGRDLHALPLIAVHFPKSADGRGYSHGAVLRRLGYRGELRAFGDIGRDHLLQLRRCGFDAFVLPPGRDPESALAAFGEFTVFYQGCVDDPTPLFRRRAPARQAP